MNLVKETFYEATIHVPVHKALEFFRNYLQSQNIPYEESLNMLKIKLIVKLYDFIFYSVWGELCAEFIPVGKNSCKFKLSGLPSFNPSYLAKTSKEKFGGIDELLISINKIYENNVVLSTYEFNHLTFFMLILLSIFSLITIVIINITYFDKDVSIITVFLVILQIPSLIFSLKDLERRFFMKYSTKNYWKVILIFAPIVGQVLYYLKVVKGKYLH